MLASALVNPFTLEAWLREVWTVLPDPPDAEFIRSPAFVIRCSQFEGDCDDASTLAASVLIAMGSRAWFMAIRTWMDTDFSHVFVRVPELNLDIDPIVPAEMIPLSYQEAMVLHV